MLKAARVSIFAGLACLSALGAAGRGQEPGGFGGVQSFGFSSSYSPTSTHILIGDAEHRRVFTLGAEYPACSANARGSGSTTKDR